MRLIPSFLLWIVAFHSNQSPHCETMPDEKTFLMSAATVATVATLENKKDGSNHLVQAASFNSLPPWGRCRTK
jgi:hypothetical protein